MKSVIALLLLMWALPQTANQSDNPGLQILSLSASQQVIRGDAPHSPVVSQSPPQINPTLGRGTADATETREQAALREKREDSDRRQRELENLPRPQIELRGRPFVVYSFHATLKNITTDPIKSFVWAYRLPVANAPEVEIQYLCKMTIAPGKTKEAKVISTVPNQRVVNVSSTATAPSAHDPVAQDMIVNQMKFADGHTWQRPGWNPMILTEQVARKLSSSKCVQL